MIKNWLSCAALVIALSVGACNKSSGSGKLKLVYIPKNTGNPYFEPLIEGCKKAAAEDGMEFESIAPATADATSQLPIIEDQMQKGVTALTISPNSPDALNATFKEAMGRGITVVCSDSDLTGHEQYRNAAVVTVDPKAVGFGQVELLGSLIDYKGKIAILSATTDAPNQNVWIGHMKEALKDPKYKNMELVAVVYGNDEPQKSLTEAEALLTKYPDLRGIIAPTTVGVAACAQAVETAGKEPQVQVTGLGTPNQMRRFIKNGTVKAFALWSPFDEGYLTARVAYLIATKKVTPGPGVKFDAGKLGQREFNDKNVVVTGPPLTFTKDNIDQFNF